jgi:hypothetical protein
MVVGCSIRETDYFIMSLSNLELTYLCWNEWGASFFSYWHCSFQSRDLFSLGDDQGRPKTRAISSIEQGLTYIGASKFPLIWCIDNRPPIHFNKNKSQKDSHTSFSSSILMQVFHFNSTNKKKRHTYSNIYFVHIMFIYKFLLIKMNKNCIFISSFL